MTFGVGAEREWRSSGAVVLSPTPLPPDLTAQQDVRRLQVAVQDALLVGVVDGPGDLGDEPGRLARRQRAVGQALAEGAALDVLHARCTAARPGRRPRTR